MTLTLAGKDEVEMFVLSQILTRLMTRGTLTVIDPAGKRHVFKGKAAGKSVTMRIHDRAALFKMSVYPKLYMGELYMDGRLTIEEGDLYEFLELLILNLDWSTNHRFSWLGDLVQKLIWLATRYNPRGRSLNNVAHHYDLSDELYELFLDKNRQYSCGYFKTPEDDIDLAQVQKMTHIAAKLDLSPDQKVLDIGCGWGGLARFIAENSDAHVTGVTLSKNQLAYAKRLAGEKGLENKVTYSLTDYRDVAEKFDRVVSVGMFEHVGEPHYMEFFAKVKEVMKKDGVALIHTIGAANSPSPINPWIDKWIFPGSYLPSLSQMATVAEKIGLYITDVEVLRVHYAETLKAWRKRFNENRDKARTIYDERFCRMWDFYLASVEAAFRHGSLIVFQMQLARR
ncbi:MAG: class I SAM-dependent methyltransferase, partial [Alphaproteobacteria bacterium]